MRGTFDYVVVGGGIVGLTIAREIKLRSSSSSVVIIEKERDVGHHASGRNSGVLHAGFYYAPESLKAQLTARGNQLLRRFCLTHDVPVIECGKVVVTDSPEDVVRLNALYERGRANGVPLELIDEDFLRRLEPQARTLHQALWSPTTAVADPRLVIQALKTDVEQMGIEVHSSTMAVPDGSRHLATSRGSYSAGHLVNAAGLYADRVATQFGFCDDFTVMPFKGLYWYGNRSAPPIRRHVYPVPDPRNPFLGVHFTVTGTGQVKVGPTAIPVLWREAYRGLGRFRLDDARDVSASFPSFLRSEHHDVLGLLRSELPKYSRRRLLAKARQLVPAARAKHFTARGEPGIRAQLMHKASGRLEMDFIVRGDHQSTHVLNAVSPAWTSSLAFAEHVVDGMSAHGAI